MQLHPLIMIIFASLHIANYPTLHTGRLDKEIELNVPSSTDREDILLKMLRGLGVTVHDSHSKTELISNNDAHSSSGSTGCNSNDSSSHRGSGNDCPTENSRVAHDIVRAFGNMDISIKSNQFDSYRHSDAAIEIGKKMSSGSDNPSVIRPLTTSFIRQLAERAHGMVGCDLLQAVKEAFFISLKRDIQKNIGRADGCTLDGSLMIAATAAAAAIHPFGREESTLRNKDYQSVEKNYIDGSNDKISKVQDNYEANRTDGSIFRESNRISFNDEVEMESDATYRPITFISDDDSEDEGITRKDGDQSEEVVEGEEEVHIRSTDTCVDKKELEEIARCATEGRTEKGDDGNSTRHSVLGLSGPSRILLEEDLILAFKRISPSALRSILDCSS